MKLQVLKAGSSELLLKINRTAAPASSVNSNFELVSEILKEIKQIGLPAIQKFRQKYDHVETELESISSADLQTSANKVDPKTQIAINNSIQNVRNYHAAQKYEAKPVETQKGVVCWREALPIESVGLYVPGGTAPLFSSLIMLAVPALLAGSKRIVVCTPPDQDLGINPELAYISQQLGLKDIYLIGGAQAIGLMAYGCEGFARVSKIFGPGNSFVTCAKQIVSSEGVAIDMPAGPSEVLVLADSSARADFVALDLLSQCEHGPDSQAVLISNSSVFIEKVQNELMRFLQQLPRQMQLKASLQNSFAVIVENLEEGIALSNQYAPEHLILACENSEQIATKVCNAGSVFIGHYSAEVFGDYATGPNHTLPTAGFACAYSGVSLDSFTKFVSFQKISREGADNLAETVVQMARREGLEAHALAANIRLKDL
jgi:histidinol dehydrogenase